MNKKAQIRIVFLDSAMYKIKGRRL